MTYIANIPLPGDKPSVSQGQMNQNFLQLNSQFSSEHNAFDSPAADGKHKYVTLQRSLGVPPAGTNMVIAQALTPAGNPYLQALNSTNIFSIPLTYINPAGIAIAAGSGTRTLIDFAALGFIPQAGTLLLYDNSDITRTVFSPFVYRGGILETPGTAGQLVAGSVFTRFDSAGSVLQLVVVSYPIGGTTVSLRVMGTAI